MSGSHVAGDALLPVRVEPLAGEAIDSWLEATTHSMDMTLGALVRRLKLPTATRPYWLVNLSQDQLREIECATRVTPDIARSMVLEVYDDTALQILELPHRLDAAFPYGPLVWSRFCPGCLAESGGRWQLAWRLGWSFACIKHQCLLVDCCPDCGERQRRYQVYRAVPRPVLCRCSRRLDTVTALGLPANHAISEAQRQITRVLAADAAEFGVFADSLPYAREALAVVRSLANRILNYASVHGLAAVKSADLPQLGSAESLAAEPLLGRSTLNPKAPMRAVEAVVCRNLSICAPRAPKFLPESGLGPHQWGPPHNSGRPRRAARQRHSAASGIGAPAGRAALDGRIDEVVGDAIRPSLIDSSLWGRRQLASTFRLFDAARAARVNKYRQRAEILSEWLGDPIKLRCMSTVGFNRSSGRATHFLHRHHHHAEDA